MLLRHAVGMRAWVANLIGLALGFTISGEAAFIIIARNQNPPEPPSAIATTQPSPPPAVSAARPAQVAFTPPSPLPAPRPVELPRFTAPPTSPSDTLPNVIYPDTPTPTQHKPGSAVAGTGFFVASDGTLLTAAHVVADCRRTRIASQLVKPADAQLLASDPKQDIALLRAHVTPPATLSIGHPAGPGGRLFVLGYPEAGGPLIPTETWADLDNAKLKPAPPEFIDARRWVWVEAPGVAHGFSGGPMVDPRNGTVVGIVRGLVDSRRLHAERAAIPASGMVVGPGSSPLTALLQKEGTYADAIAVSGDDALDSARRATVHVLCLY
jgi:S1-C subfamily serine protease